MARPVARLPVRHHLSRQLCRPLQREGAVQFRDGARRRRHRQLPLHGGPDRPPAPLRARPGAGHPSRHGPARLFRLAASSPSASSACARLGASQPHQRVVLLAARLTDWKGQKVLIEAARKLRRPGPRRHRRRAGRRPPGPRQLCPRARRAGRDAESGRDRASGRPLHRHAGGLPHRLSRHRALHRAGGLRALGCRGAGDGRAGRGVRPRRGARDRARAA